MYNVTRVKATIVAAGKQSIFLIMSVNL